MTVLWPLIATAMTVYLAWHFVKTIHEGPPPLGRAYRRARRWRVIASLLAVGGAFLIIRCIWWVG